MKPILVVLAAGMGSRYGGLKQIDPVGPSGEAIIDYSIYDAIRAGFGKIVFVIRRDIEDAFKKAFGDKFAAHVEVEYVFQEMDMVPAGLSYDTERTKPWGTGHAVMVSAPAINGPFAVINADDFYGKGAYEVLANYLSPLTQTSTSHCLVGYKLANTLSDFGSVSRGVCGIDAEGYMSNVVERTKIERKDGQIVFTNDEGAEEALADETLVSMNMWGFAQNAMQYFETYFKDFIREKGFTPKAEFYIPTVVNLMLSANAGKVKMLSSDAKWFGVTYKEDKPYVETQILNLVEAGVYQHNLWK